MNTHRNIRNELVTTTQVELCAGQVLRIETSKCSGGVLRTSATAHHRTETGFLTHTMAMFNPNPLESDFREVLAAEKARCTAKALETQHQGGIAKAGGIDAILERARRHQEKRQLYTGKVAA